MLPDSNPPKILYHYCPSDSFHGIVTNKSIRLSNCLYSNDPNENQISGEILKEIYADPIISEIKDIAKKVLDFKIIEENVAYVFCMSQKEDDLNQWRIYGDNGYGYSLGFSTDYFIKNKYWKLLSKVDILPQPDQIYLAKCIYDKNMQRKLIERLLSIFIVLHGIPEDKRIINIKVGLQLFSAIFKHLSYSAENEWRLICFPISQPQIEGIDIKYNLKFKTKRGLISQYIEQDFMDKSKIRKCPFETIYLGSNVLNRGDEIMDFLHFQGGHYTKLIKKSELKMKDK